MTVIFSRRALADLEQISSYYAALDDPRLGVAVEARIGEVIARVVPLIRYPYNIFYRASGDRIDILHIRHTSRRPWEGG